MSDIKFACPQCGQHLAVDASAAGMTVACPQCGHTTTPHLALSAKPETPKQAKWWFWLLLGGMATAVTLVAVHPHSVKQPAGRNIPIPANFTTAAPLPAPVQTRVFHVSDFGAVADGKSDSGEAIRSAITAAVAAGRTAGPPLEVVLDSGTYSARPDNPGGYCFPVYQATNLIVRGAGEATKIVVTDPRAGAFFFSFCHQVSLRDLVVDYDPVPFCQGTIRAVDIKAGSFDLEVEAGYPTPDAENFLKAESKWGMIMDRTTRRIRAGTPDNYQTPRWEHAAGRVWRFFTADEHHRLNLQYMRIGDAYVHLARGGEQAVHAFGCDGVRIENIVVHAAPILAVSLMANRGDIVVRGLRVCFTPGTTRLLTTDADGVHCQQNRSGPVIEDCYFEGMADDAVTIYARPNVLLEIRSATQWLVSPGTMVLAEDRLQVLDPKTGRLRREVKAVEVKSDPRGFLITLDQPHADAVAGADSRTADTLYDLDACGAGFQIRRNHMNGNRRTGCVLFAGDGVVEDNTFEDTTGVGVMLCDDPDWPIGPVPSGIAIRRNRFIRGGMGLWFADSPDGAALAVNARRLGHALAQAEVIRDVVIENNEFQDRAGAAIYVGAASNVTIRSNHIVAALGAELRRKGAAILIEHSSGVALLDNAVSDPRPGTTAAVQIGPGVPSGDAGVRISGLKSTLPIVKGGSL